MSQSDQIFDDVWRGRAATSNVSDSCAKNVFDTLNSGGNQYLATLTEWYTNFPVPSAIDHSALRTRLESFNTSDHLGAVNEPAWYRFMQHAGFKVAPVPTSTTPRPDFRITAPVAAFEEVSTLNVSQGEKASLDATGGVDLDHEETLRRLLRKAADEKWKQLEYAATMGSPCLLVLFDYTFWSGFATNFYRFVASELLGDEPAFSDLPSSLSAIVYVERCVTGGRIRLSRIRSAVYHNPGAHHPITHDVFNMLRQSGRDIRETNPNSEGDWIEL